MKINDVISYFGNQNRAAIELEISRAAVSKWVRNGVIPKLRQYQIERLTKGKLKADE